MAAGLAAGQHHMARPGLPDGCQQRPGLHIGIARSRPLLGTHGGKIQRRAVQPGGVLRIAPRAGHRTALKTDEHGGRPGKGGLALQGDEKFVDRQGPHHRLQRALHLAVSSTSTATRRAPVPSSWAGPTTSPR